MTEIIDARGLSCPLPVLRAKKALKDALSGSMFEVLTTDPGSVKDFEHFCETTGHRLIDANATGGIFSYRIEKVR